MSNVIEFKKLPARAYKMDKESSLSIALTGLTHLVEHSDTLKADWLVQHCPWLTPSRVDQLCRNVLSATKEHYRSIRAQYFERASPILQEEVRDEKIGLALTWVFDSERQHRLVTVLRAEIVTMDELQWNADFIWKLNRSEDADPDDWYRFSRFLSLIGYWDKFHDVPEKMATCRECSCADTGVCLGEINLIDSTCNHCWTVNGDLF